MARYTASLPSAGASLAQLITDMRRELSAVATSVNKVEGGTGTPNINSSTVQRLQMHNNASVGRFLGDIFSTNTHVRKGGTVAKVSGRVFSVADGRWYMVDRAVTPFECYQRFETGISNDSVLASRRTFLDMGTDGIISKNDVALGADAPALADGKIRFCRISASAAIHTVTMLGNSTFVFGNSYPKGYHQNIRVISPLASASAARYVTVKSGTEIRDKGNLGNITFTADTVGDLQASGAGGLDTGSRTSARWYGVFAVGDTTGANSPKVVFAFASASATLPTGYDIQRRIAWRRASTGANLVPAITNGDETFGRRVQNAIALASTSAATRETIDFTTYAPATVNIVKCIIMNVGGGTTQGKFRFWPKGQTPSASAASTFLWDDGSVNNFDTAHRAIECSDSQRAYVKRDSGTGRIKVHVGGYIDRLV